MQQLAETPRSEGKMYGVLLVETPTGELGVLKAFSGLLEGQAVVTGWVPPIPGREKVAIAEAQTLQKLEEFKQALIKLQALPERAEYERLSQHYQARLQDLAATHRQTKGDRDRRRETYHATLTGEELEQALAALVRESQQDGMGRRRLKQERDRVLAPLKDAIAVADAQIQQFKQERKRVSRRLQAQMHQVYSLTNFAGLSTSLTDLLPGGLPTGTGDCAAPKLLHYAATQGLKPIAMAEFWWGEARGDKQPGEFYGACGDRCQPIMGFLLSGLTAPEKITRSRDLTLSIVYEDATIVVVDKPSGLLSVPGRRSHQQDSVLSRLQCQFGGMTTVHTVHRLDQDTSGLLVLAKTPEAQANLAKQFADRQVEKVYEAVLSGAIAAESGVIELPLWGDPRDRPRQSVNDDHGKLSRTEFQRLSAGTNPRVRLIPHTGRTHQLRVHTAVGLNAPILGDRLYGDGEQTERLHLHAGAIAFQHPAQDQRLEFTSPVPF